jgi:hypothetical protein
MKNESGISVVEALLAVASRSISLVKTGFAE